MSAIKTLITVLVPSICVGTLLTFSTPAKADGSFPDISGTNVWNSTAPVFDTRGGGIDPALLDRARRLNQEADEAYKACDAAVLAAQQQGPQGPRQYLRNPGSVEAVYPEPCQRLNALRDEAVSLRRQLDEAGRAGGNAAYRTW